MLILNNGKSLYLNENIIAVSRIKRIVRATDSVTRIDYADQPNGVDYNLSTVGHNELCAAVQAFNHKNSPPPPPTQKPFETERAIKIENNDS